MRKSILNLLIGLFIFLSSFSQTPNAIPYQAVIRNTDGLIIANQAIKIRFSLHDSIINGNILYQEVQAQNTNSQGIINVNIGMGTTILGTFNSLDWSKNNKYLQTELDINNDNLFTDLGTTQFLSVPFSLHSKTAENGMPDGVNDGEILYWSNGKWIKLTPGSYGQSLIICDGLPSWGGCLPKLTTTSISSVTSNSGICSGNILSDGGSPILERGFCYSINSNPTIMSVLKINTGNNFNYQSTLSGLSPYTKYYVRAYAINSVGIGYGDQQEFRTIMPSVTIGSQIWSKQNSEVSTYRNGDTIPNITNSTEWASLTTGAWCWYNNDSANFSQYGKLYNWYAVNDARGLAPEGWHIPTDSDWIKLTSYLGSTTIVGSYLKSTTGWSSFNGTNSSGFNGYPGGYRENTLFSNTGNYGYWWSSTESGVNNAWTRVLFSGNSGVSRQNFSKKYGISVRLIKDD